ncbi:MAG: phenylalanine--tRNA ligase subunit beta [Desulfobulbus propionicus]|nr:MAG: phenylalanine--tRNA ligase subunit beta [Desulfobulbus propionicus]
MKVTLGWLGQFISLDGLTAEQIADRLTMAGLEVDSLTPMTQGLDDLICARVVETVAHPNADKLTLCTVDDGTEKHQVVCGAPNVRAGMMTAFAPVGSVLPGKHKIKKAKVRGELSNGMLCSRKELELGDDHSGILDIEGDCVAGQPLTEALQLEDTVIEIDLTPNRPDCASVRGIAREIAGFTGRQLKATGPASPCSTAADGYSVHIDDPGLCPRYTCRKIQGVNIGPSPWWMQQRLLAADMRPINTIVDITNYVMLELGQPLHAFDLHKIKGGTLNVRTPLQGETELVTLDGSSRTLTPDTLLICDGQGPIALAGVMGGLDSEVTAETVDVLLESACFDPVSIRRTARRLKLPSESSYRFERGVDPELAPLALERACTLMAELAGGRPDDSGGIDCYPGKQQALMLELRLSRVNALLGLSLTGREVAALLQAIEFAVEPISDEVLRVQVPSFRVDIAREVDLVEEVARLVGYDTIPVTMPYLVMGHSPGDPLRSLRRQLAATLTSLGFSEAINYSFVRAEHPDMAGLATEDPRRDVVRLLNPLSEDQAVMRSMLLPGLLENVLRNHNFQNTDVRLFEIGKVFRKGVAELPEERFRLCAVLSGNRHAGNPAIHAPAVPVDIFDCKGALEALLAESRCTGSAGELSFRQPATCEPFVDGEQALDLMDGKNRLGLLGKVHAQTCRQFDLRQEVFFFELDLEAILQLPKKEKSFTPLPRFPAVKRDIALIVPADVPAGALLSHVRKCNERFLETVELFDVYSGDQVDEGMQSVALAVTYRSPDKTLNEKNVDTMHTRLVNSLMTTFGGHYRKGM